MRYLWFPPDALDEGDLERINAWKERFEQYVLLGLNTNISEYFSDELDFCMALDLNFDPRADRRTLYGEAEYQLKYRQSLPHFSALRSALAEAMDFLPLTAVAEGRLSLTSIPAHPDTCNTARKLARSVAEARALDCIQADLLCEKSAMKNTGLAGKIRQWEELYDTEGCVELREDVEARIMVVVDDLYQSGATLWSYAKYLKQMGAEHVLGLVCVKALRDTDNQ
jgi:predicted amidophosphoribosyltransferase